MHDEILERCRALAPALEARAAQAERLRRLPDETIDDAAASDLYRMVLPKGCGGLGLGLDTLAQATRLLAHGCVSSAWTLSFLAMHNWMLSKFGAELRREIFAKRGYVLAPAPLAPTGRVTRVEGGFRLDGRWEWATGVMHGDWLIVHAIEPVDGSVQTRFCVVPIDQARIDDVWFTSGMRATGSNTVVIEDRFVPEHRTLLGELLMRGAASAGPAPLEDAFGAYPVVPVLALVAAAPALGAAERAVDLFRERMKQRVLAYSLGERQAAQPAAQVRLADALAVVRSAAATWDAGLLALRHACMRSTTLAPLDAAAVRLAAANTVRLSREAIAIVCAGSGASVYFEDHPLQRLQRDVEVLKGHVVFDWDRTAELVGRLELGLAPRPTDML